MVLAAVVIGPIALSQMEQAQPVVYTYVSQFQVPRANWAQYSENTEKTFVLRCPALPVPLLAKSTQRRATPQ